MRILLSLIGVIMICVGGIFFLQGINIIPGSFMTGQMQWAVYGGIILVAGVMLLMSANRRRA
ncbi:MAG: hypothetical protein ABIZ36_13380 [Gemmatimonadaceae bacterium]